MSSLGAVTDARRRAPFEGALAILRFNWPFYVVAVAVIVVGVAAVIELEAPVLRLAVVSAIVVTAWFLVASLLVSHLVYDRSDVYRFGWLRRVPGFRGQRLVSCHAGYDEITAGLRASCPDGDLVILDHFDREAMPAASIRRARHRYPMPTEAVRASVHSWPIAVGEATCVLGVFAIHELRHEPDRVAWFTAARRALAPGGCVVIVEHVRDTANFIAFGPGFLHFHALSTWRRAWEAAGLRVIQELRITPFVRAFALAEP